MIIKEEIRDTELEIKILKKQNEYFKKQILSMNKTIEDLQIINKTDTQRLDWLESSKRKDVFVYTLRPFELGQTLREYIDKQIIKENGTTE